MIGNHGARGEHGWIIQGCGTGSGVWCGGSARRGGSPRHADAQERLGSPGNDPQAKRATGVARRGSGGFRLSREGDRPDRYQWRRDRGREEAGVALSHRDRATAARPRRAGPARRARGHQDRHARRDWIWRPHQRRRPCDHQRACRSGRDQPSGHRLAAAAGWHASSPGQKHSSDCC